MKIDKKNFWQVAALIFAVLLGLSLIVNAVFIAKNSGLTTNGIRFAGSVASSLVQPVSAQEIYPLFECPCCGKTIEECDCGMAGERRAFVDSLVQAEISEDELILAYVKKYGLNSFIDKEKQEEFREKLIAEAPNDRPVISLSPDSYDLGDVSQEEGIATIFFEVRNEGKNDLVIDRIETSCGCTSASIVYQNEEGPIFTMPGHNKEAPTDWQVVILSGETAQLKAYYDPNAHKDLRGAVTRTISLFSNDPIDFEKKVKIELNQVD